MTRPVFRLLAVPLVFLGLATSAAPEDSSLSLIAPADKAVFTFPDVARATVTFTWQAVPGISEFWLTVGQDADPSRPIVQRTSAESTISVRGFREGKYFWRVEALGANGTIAARSEVRVLTLKSGTP